MFWFFPSSVIFLSQYIESNTIIFYLWKYWNINFIFRVIEYLLVERPVWNLEIKKFKSFFDKKQDSINFEKLVRLSKINYLPN